MRKYLLLGALLAVITGCSNDTLIYEQNPEETTFALSKQAEQAPVYKMVETEDKNIILFNVETNKQELKVVNYGGGDLTIIAMLLIVISIIFFIGLLISMTD
jgi:ABC-type glycerol-3-phosphate transport system substrate-binding protein